MAVISELKLKSKNLINKETSEDDFFINSSGVKTYNESYGLAVTDKIYVKPSTTYTYSGMGNVRVTTVGRTGFQYDKDDNPIEAIPQSYGEDVTFTTAENCSYVLLIYVRIEQKQMLELGSEKTEYIPHFLNVTKYNNELVTNISSVNELITGLPTGDYHFAKRQEELSLVCDNAVEEPIIDLKITGNSVQNEIPTPETPIEIQSVGEKTKNLIDIPDIDGSTQSTKITCNLTKTFIVSCQEYPTLITNNSGVETSIWRIMFTYQDGTLQYIMDDGLKKVGNYVNYFRPTEQNPIVSITYRGIYIRQGAYKGIQIEYGETETEYEPYGYKVPVNVRGKNLFDYTKMVGSNITILNNSVRVKGYSLTTQITPEMFLEITGLKEGDQITTSLSKKIISGTVNTMFGVLIFYKQPIGTGGDLYLTKAGLQNNEISVGTVTIPSDFTFNNYGYLFAYGGFADDNGNVEFEFSNIQIEKGTTATDYEPYLDKTTNIYIKEPLRKIGDYADYLDYKNKKVVRNIAVSNLDSGLGWSPDDEKHIFTLYGLTGGKSFNKDKVTVLCSHYKAISEEEIESYVEGVAGDGVILRLFDENIQTPEAYREFFEEQQRIGKPLTVIYILETPIEETINCPEILTHKGTNIFSIESNVEPSSVETTYWKQIGLGEEISEEPGGGTEEEDAPVEYGITIDMNNSDPDASVTYSLSALGLSGAYMDFENDKFVDNGWLNRFPFNKIKPCLFSSTGEFVGYLNPNDYSKFEDGTSADISTPNSGDVMIEFPHIYYDITTTDDNKISIKITNVKKDGYCERAFTYKGVITDKLYISAYRARWQVDNPLAAYFPYSLSGTPHVSSYISSTIDFTIPQNMMEYTRAKGYGYEMMPISVFTMLQCLYLLMFKNLNSQARLGCGVVGAKILKATGALDQKGMYYGQATSSQMKLFGIEDLYGNGSHLLPGMIFDIKRNLYVLDPMTNEDYTYLGDKDVYPLEYTAPANVSLNFISKMYASNNTGFIPAASTGSASTYFCDKSVLKILMKNFRTPGKSSDTDLGMFALQQGDNTLTEEAICRFVYYKDANKS